MILISYKIMLDFFDFIFILSRLSTVNKLIRLLYLSYNVLCYELSVVSFVLFGSNWICL